MKKISKEAILEIISDSNDCYEALLNLYKHAISPISWDRIDSIKPWEIQVNNTTGTFILNEMHKKYSKENDNWTVNALILNKGFSSNHEEIPDWKVRVTKDCYILTPA